jgi:hypothetical protein
MELPLVVRKTKRPAVLSFIAAVGMACAYFYWHPNVWADGIAFGLACGLSFVAVVCLAMLINPKPHLAILGDSSAYRARKGRLTQLMMSASRESGCGDLAITPSTLGVNVGDLLQLIRQQLAAGRSKQGRAPSAVKYRTDKSGNWV